MLRPFAGFLLFCIGKLLTVIFMIIFLDSVIPGFTTKPIMMYCLIGVLMLSPLGLHLFLAYQEFVFFSFCSYYQTFAKRVMESSGDQPTLTRLKTAEQNQIVRYNPPARATFHDNLEELVEIMKNMTETFGPFLLQNFSFMLLFWILHIYPICFVVIEIIRNPSALSIGPAVGSSCTQIAGGILIVR